MHRHDLQALYGVRRLPPPPPEIHPERLTSLARRHAKMQTPIRTKRSLCKTREDRRVGVSERKVQHHQVVGRL